jgi:hypothetical protein
MRISDAVARAEAEVSDACKAGEIRQNTKNATEKYLFERKTILAIKT